MLEISARVVFSRARRRQERRTRESASYRFYHNAVPIKALVEAATQIRMPGRLSPEMRRR